MFTRRIFPLLIPLTIAAWVALVRYPVSFGLIRLAVVTLGVLIVGQVLAAIWPWRLIRASLLGVLLLFAGFLTLPGRNEVSRAELAETYLIQLRSFQAVPYVWGGENYQGIDCSGLVRRAWAEALLLHGVQHLNPASVRAAFSMWWHDLSAKALRDEARGLTVRRFEARSINEVEPARLSPGDLAATQDGVHVMAYLGEKLWIEADPGADRVIIKQAPSPRNPWFAAPVVILQWKELTVP